MASAPTTSPSTVDDSESAGQVYFCHKCTRNVYGVNEDLECPVCHSGFLELLEGSEGLGSNENDSNDVSRSNSEGQSSNVASWGSGPHSITNANDFMQEFMPLLLQQIIPQAGQASQPTTSQASSAGTSETGQQNPPALGFLQQLVEVLTAGGGAFSLNVQMEGDNDTGQPTGTGGTTGNPFFLNMFGNPGDYAWGPDSLDSIVTQLLNQVEGGATPLTKDQISTLQKVTVSQGDVDNRQQCPVCFEDFQLDEVVVGLECSHRFHIACIEPWMERHNSCPVCRKPAVEVENPAGSGGNSFNQATPGSNPTGGNVFQFTSNQSGNVAPGSNPAATLFSGPSGGSNNSGRDGGTSTSGNRAPELTIGPNSNTATWSFSFGGERGRNNGGNQARGNARNSNRSREDGATGGDTNSELDPLDDYD